MGIDLYQGDFYSFSRNTLTTVGMDYHKISDLTFFCLSFDQIPLLIQLENPRINTVHIRLAKHLHVHIVTVYHCALVQPHTASSIGHILLTIEVSISGD